MFAERLLSDIIAWWEDNPHKIWLEIFGFKNR